MRALRLAAPVLAALSAAQAQAQALRPTQDSSLVEHELDLAYGAYQRGLYLTALREATARLARDPEDAAAMTLLGELHNQGLGVRQDPAKAAEWYRLAAKRGDAHALAALGLMAMDGRGTDKNPGQGRAWLEQAAAKGEPTACYNLALLLLSSGAQADLLRAVELLRTAAEAEVAAVAVVVVVESIVGMGLSGIRPGRRRGRRRAARWWS